MNAKTKFIFFSSLVLLVIQCSFKSVHAQDKSAAIAPSGLKGQVGLTSNYIDRGITQSANGVSMNTSLYYRFGDLGKLGLGAASVKYRNESATVETRLFGEFKFIFTPNSDLLIRNDLLRYFSEDRRNKVSFTLDQNFFSYHILFSREDNFEGTSNKRNWFAFQKEWNLWADFPIDSHLGYSMVEGYDSYFDLMAAIQYKITDFKVALGISYVSSSTQFNGAADPSGFFKLNAEF